ncbi:fumarate hydratase [Methanobacterium congolense]|uniref:Putative L(+)-tartrate dehydratase subunit alpha n=1 Tax=Methanobacterium congolense TaxID=118062 RepID=A0A1D3L463_9EURY|nr:fumarate hydratase [Methanobacterium congolense]SCG86345.1 putative L(+)-tartrate dehydratase subunit alpha [Methanobacterium congolense]
MITQKQVEDAVCRIYRDAVIELPEDVTLALRRAHENEDNKTARLNLGTVLKNIEAANTDGIPMCQDTGLPIVFVKLGRVRVENLYQGIRNGVERATMEVPLRPNVVDPLTRKNTGTNTGKGIPQVDVELVDGDYLELTVFPKGFGSENNNALKMGLPGEGVEGIKNFVVETVKAAGGKPCPPTRIGVGIGGSSDMALKLAKKALLRDVQDKNSDERLSKLEEELLEAVNATGIGPMGLGGKTTALDVKVEMVDTHTAGLPIGICIQCWAARHSSIVLMDE